jgi:Ca2+-binding EF-hand superfamily protein
MKMFFLSAATAIAVAGFAPALAQTAAVPAAPVPAAPGRHMHNMKPVTRAAFLQRVQKQFARLDSNRDGFLTQDEAQAAAQAMRSRMEQGMAQRSSRLFDRLDTNNDGEITQAEFNAATANRPQQAANASHRTPSWDRLAARFDTNHDGQITRVEFDAARAAHGQRTADTGKPRLHRAGFAAQMFATADLNHDGRVSLQEATQAASQRFDAADTNHDGVLTPDEMRAIHQFMHPKG